MSYVSPSAPPAYTSSLLDGSCSTIESGLPRAVTVFKLSEYMIVSATSVIGSRWTAARSGPLRISSMVLSLAPNTTSSAL